MPVKDAGAGGSGMAEVGGEPVGPVPEPGAGAEDAVNRRWVQGIRAAVGPGEAILQAGRAYLPVPVELAIGGGAGAAEGLGVAATD